MILKYKSCLKCLKQIKHLSTAPISHKQKDLEHYDVIIAGGGLVGFSASLALGLFSILYNI